MAHLHTPCAAFVICVLSHSPSFDELWAALETVELSALDDSGIRALCHGCGVPFREDSHELLERGGKLKYESMRPISKRLCPPGLSQCCAGYACSEKGGHQGRHRHLLSCPHQMAYLLHKARWGRKKQK